jgi:hypothetical protein
LSTGNAFAGEHGLVDGGVSFRDFTIGGDPLAGADQDQVILHQQGSGNDFLRSVLLQDRRFIRRELLHPLDRVERAALAARFQELAKRTRRRSRR